MANRMGEIVKKFYEFSDVFQVRVHELVKDPFQVEGLMKGVQDPTAVSDDPQAQAELIRRQKMQQQASTLKLLSIMRSDRGNSCMINDQILRQGDAIEGFTITQIASNCVELAWSPEATAGSDASETEEMKITLKLSD
jgi:hypothetical protein